MADGAQLSLIPVPEDSRLSSDSLRHQACVLLLIDKCRQNTQTKQTRLKANALNILVADPFGFQQPCWAAQSTWVWLKDPASMNMTEKQSRVTPIFTSDLYVHQSYTHTQHIHTHASGKQIYWECVCTALHYFHNTHFYEKSPISTLNFQNILLCFVCVYLCTTFMPSGCRGQKRLHWVPWTGCWES